MSGEVIRGRTGPGLEVLSCGPASDRIYQDPPSKKTVSQIRPIRPRIGKPAIPFSGSTGNDVHAHGRNGISGVFSKTGQKEGHFNLQYSGPVRATVFRRGYCMWVGLKWALLASRLTGPGGGDIAQEIHRWNTIETFIFFAVSENSGKVLTLFSLIACQDFGQWC